MNATFMKLSALAIAFSMSTAISPAYSQGKGKGKAKGQQDVEAKKGNMAVKPVRCLSVSNNSPKRREISLQDCRIRKMTMDH
jgi:hypothetical protein